MGVINIWRQRESGYIDKDKTFLENKQRHFFQKINKSKLQRYKYKFKRDQEYRVFHVYLCVYIYKEALALP